LGYGVHREGQWEWDGRRNSFSQLVRNSDDVYVSTKSYGVFEDVAAFYASGNGANRLSLPLRVGFVFLARGANRRIEYVRATA
jgi:hypothetical protein